MCFDDSVSSFVSLNFFRGTVLDLVLFLHRRSFSSAVFFPLRFMGLRTLFVTLALLFLLAVVSFLDSFVISNLQSLIEPFELERLDTVSVINQVDRVRKRFCHWLCLFFLAEILLPGRENLLISSNRFQVLSQLLSDLENLVMQQSPSSRTITKPRVWRITSSLILYVVSKVQREKIDNSLLYLKDENRKHFIFLFWLRRVELLFREKKTHFDNFRTGFCFHLHLLCPQDLKTWELRGVKNRKRNDVILGRGRSGNFRSFSFPFPQILPTHSSLLPVLGISFYFSMRKKEKILLCLKFYYLFSPVFWSAFPLFVKLSLRTIQFWSLLSSIVWLEPPAVTQSLWQNFCRERTVLESQVSVLLTVVIITINIRPSFWGYGSHRELPRELPFRIERADGNESDSLPVSFLPLELFRIEASQVYKISSILDVAWPDLLLLFMWDIVREDFVKGKAEM